jgi:hypothetical protein
LRYLKLIYKTINCSTPCISNAFASVWIHRRAMPTKRIISVLRVIPFR